MGFYSGGVWIRYRTLGAILMKGGRTFNIRYCLSVTAASETVLNASETEYTDDDVMRWQWVLLPAISAYLRNWSTGELRRGEWIDSEDVYIELPPTPTPTPTATFTPTPYCYTLYYTHRDLHADAH